MSGICGGATPGFKRGSAVEGEVAADIGEAKEIPVRRVHHRSIRLRQSRNLGVAHEITAGSSRALEQLHDLPVVIGLRLENLTDSALEPRLDVARSLRQGHRIGEGPRVRHHTNEAENGGMRKADPFLSRQATLPPLARSTVKGARSVVGVHQKVDVRNDHLRVDRLDARSDSASGRDDAMTASISRSSAN